MGQTIYDLLTGVKIEDLQVTSLDDATGRTFVDTQTVDFWQGIMTLSHVLKGARTYPHGLPLPETGVVEVASIADGANHTFGTGIGTEIWLVLNIDADSCSFALKDNDGNICPLDLTQVRPQSPLYLTTTMNLVAQNSSGSAQTPSIAYLKVSL